MADANAACATRTSVDDFHGANGQFGIEASHYHAYNFERQKLVLPPFQPD